MATFTLSATGNTQLTKAGNGTGPDGWSLNVAGTSWTGSIVLKQNQAPPGAALNLVTVAYLNSSRVSQAAGTAITGGGVFYIELTGYDLWAVYTHTAGSVQLITGAAVIPGGGTGPGPGFLPAADVTNGTFGANDGDLGTYTFPSALVIAGSLTGATTGAFSGAVSMAALTATTGTFAGAVSGVTTLAMTGALSGATSITYTTLLSSVTALATPGALAATALNVFASTVSGGVLMGFGTTNDVTLKNRAGTNVLGVTANTLNVTLAGALSAAGNLTLTASAVSAALIDTQAYNAGVSGPILALQGLDSASANTQFASLWAQPTAANPDRGFLTVYTRLNGVNTLTAQFGTGLTLASTLGGALAITGALSGVTTLAASGATTLSSGLAIRGTFTPASGSGLELFESGGTTNIQSYNRTGSAYLPMNITALSVAFTATVTFSSTVQVGTLLMIGGATASFGAIRQTTAQVEAVLADNSAFAAFKCAGLTATTINGSGVATLASGTATPAAGSTAARVLLGTTAAFGIYYGSGAPTVVAAQGSLYIRSDGSSAVTRAYVATDGAGTWTAISTVL